MLESFTGISICLSKQTIRVSLTASWSSPHKYLINCQAYANLKSLGYHRWPKLTTGMRTWLLLAGGVVLQTVIYEGLYGM